MSMIEDSTKNIHVLSRGVIIEQEHILLCKTRNLLTNFFFLPGGHVEHGESVEISLLRELVEEIGADCKIKRFLGCLEYSFDPEHNSLCHNHEYNFIFEVESIALKKNHDISCKENHIEFSWISLNKLIKIDFRPEGLKELLPLWLANTQAPIFFRSIMK